MKQKPSHRRALRSAAAKKGWETRRANAGKYWTAEEVSRFNDGGGRIAAWPQAKATTYASPVVAPTLIAEPPPPDPTPARPTWLHRLWAWLTRSA